MRCPSDAQARALSLIGDRERPEHGDRRFLAGTLVLTGKGWGYHLGRVRIDTRTACLREGWIERDKDDGEVWITDDGLIALGLWRERKLKQPPPDLPTLTGRERQVLELAQQAREMGYHLASGKETRAEVRRLKRAGWLDPHGAWIANQAQGMKLTPMALVEVRPDTADSLAERSGASNPNAPLPIPDPKEKR